MVDFRSAITIESTIYNILERNHVEDYKSLEDCEQELHEIISNLCCDYAYDKKIENYATYF